MSAKGIWKHDKLTASLPKYFELKLLSTSQDKHVNCEPPGYATVLDKKLGDAVICHEASGLRVCGHVIDLVERVDRARPPEPTSIVFVYGPLEVLKPAAALANREPTKAYQDLVARGILAATVGENYDEDGEELALGRTRTIYRWMRGGTLAEPATVAAAEAGERLQYSGQPGSYCVALHVLKARLRRAQGQDSPLVDIREAPAAPIEVELGVGLVQAARDRDEDQVRNLIRKRASVHFHDTRGWTALHAACSTRPSWPILNSLLQRGSDVCARTRDGSMPYDIAEKAENHDVVEELQRRMRQHKAGRFLPHAHVGMSGGAKSEDFAHTLGRRIAEKDEVPLLKQFATVLLSKYEDAESAFKAFDINNNGSLSGSEFIQYARLLNYQGDLMAVFKALDKDRLGDISVDEFKLLAQLLVEDKAEVFE